MDRWRPKDGWEYGAWVKDERNLRDPPFIMEERLYNAFEAGADAMCKAKDEARRPVKEVRLKLIEVDFGDMSMSEFVDWMYGEV